MTGQFTLLSMLMTRDVSWAEWKPNLIVRIDIPQARVALNINSTQFSTYINWLEERGYAEVQRFGRGWTEVKLLNLSRGLYESVISLPAADSGREASASCPVAPEAPNE